MVVGYVPNEGDDEERERFWNDLDRIVDRVGNEYRLCPLGDLKGSESVIWTLRVVVCMKTGVCDCSTVQGGRGED